MKLNFNVRGNLKQLDCVKAWLDPLVTDIVYGGSKGSGKSYLGCSLIIADALIYPGTHYFIARKKLNDLRKFTIPSIHEVFQHYGITEQYYSFNASDNYFKFANGSKIYLLQAKFEPSDPTYARFGSMQMTRGWIEEAGEFEKEAMTNLFASVGRWKNDEYNLTGKLLHTCNPAKNYLYKDYYKPNKQNELEPYKKFIQALPQDNKQLPEGYLENLNRILTKEQKERLLFGNWEYDDDPTALCSYEDILETFTNDHIEQGQSKYITADIARHGSDKAVIFVWDGWTVIDQAIFDKSSMIELQDRINFFREKYQIPRKNCIADEDGIGGGIVDNCKIKGFVNNSRPFDNRKGSEKKQNINLPNYSNLQSQCCYYLAKVINDFELYFSIDISEKQKEEIIEELEQLKSYESDKMGKMKTLPKEKIKAAIGRSPDYRDALMMRAFFDLSKKYSGKYTIV